MGLSDDIFIAIFFRLNRAIEEAVYGNNVDIVEELLDVQGVDINRRGSGG